MTSSPHYEYANYDTSPDPSHRPLYLAKLLPYLQRGGVRTVLDAGCGGGDFAVGLHEAGLTVYGIDGSESGIAAANRRGVGQFKVSSLYEDLAAPFALPSYDAVIAVEVIEHLYSPRIFVKRARAALRPGGLLVITTPYWGYAKNVMLALTDRMDAALTALWDGGHIKHWSRRTLAQLITQQGFKELAFHGCGAGVRGSTPYLWSGMMMVFGKPA
jgi:2-polyprenyl-3-methyl-5-hydroxy-6-metoxy-1,4-benzoquinol methylase